MSIAGIRKWASILLAGSFVLPLSKCTTQTTETRTYAFELLLDAINNIAAAKFDGVWMLLAVLAVFFLPLLLLGLRERERIISGILLITSILASNCLYFWVFVFSTHAMMGGVLAILAWLTLLGTSLWNLLRQELKR